MGPNDINFLHNWVRIYETGDGVNRDTPYFKEMYISALATLTAMEAGDAEAIALAERDFLGTWDKFRQYVKDCIRIVEEGENTKWLN